jgi:hypothetical protein
LPEGSFDKAKAEAALAAAREASSAGRKQDASKQAEAAVAAWPGDPAAWAEWAAACQAADDQSCRQMADFFRAKVDFANTIPTRAAVLGFQTLSEEPPGRGESPAKAEMAKRLWAFYDVQDRGKDLRKIPEEPSFGEEYPYAAMLMVGGTVAGILTLAKTLANK